MRGGHKGLDTHRSLLAVICLAKRVARSLVAAGFPIPIPSVPKISCAEPVKVKMFLVIF
jgi:hypothetical protein